ncbi:MAG: response regulator transcription factor [Gammaproteobacteria bacterium]|nr:MAG: response regulator transcription factor [Gammaproteobacteria bacterium]
MNRGAATPGWGRESCSIAVQRSAGSCRSCSARGAGRSCRAALHARRCLAVVVARGSPRRSSAAATSGGSVAHRRIRVFIVDDHPLVREGLRARIAQEAGMEVCGEADSAAAATASLRRAKPDVVIVDLGLSDMHGLRLIETIRSSDPDIRIMVLSAYSETLYGERALRSGADSYVNKQQAPGSIVGAIRATAAGKRYLSKELADRLLELVLHRRSSGSAGARELSPRELEVFELIGNGKSTRDIAQQLGLSVHTIETHREKLRAKLLLRNGRELTQAAVRWVLENR